MLDETKIEIVKGVEGHSLYINDYRVCGPKPWSGGVVIWHFEVDKKEIEKALEEN